ncbi:MAG TPA: lyase family protein [Treponemataceae bacterium]|nr:lyase family protein [Treponemataceae bacterium]
MGDDAKESAGTRIEHDLIGEREIPRGALEGIHTLRASENFRLSGRPTAIELIRAYALVKKACATANRETGYLDAARADAICRACDEVASGALDPCFALDALQGGAGTSTNMNVNEVIANRANQFLALEPGDRSEKGVRPLDHVNLHQSTNDTYPTALKVALIALIREAASAAAILQGSFQKKEREFANVVTIGRTELQAAVPMTLGAIFSSFSEAAGRDRWRTFKCEERVRTVNLGGTAVGTGLAAPRSYIFRATDALRAITGFPLARAENLVDQTANADALVEIAGILSAFASNLIKEARDIRMLAHEGDVSIPAIQAGSSIMPGKVNPVVCEAVIQAGMRARASLTLVGEAAAHGTLQINEYLPLVADSLIEALKLVAAAARSLSSLVDGVEANDTACRARVESDPIIVTAFLPSIGYERAQELLAEYRESANANGETIRAFLTRKLGADAVDRALSSDALSALGFPDSPPSKGLNP